jgi:hypothetical protein
MLWDEMGLHTLSHAGNINTRSPVWNANGELVFSGYSSGGSAILVWDSDGVRQIIEGLFAEFDDFSWSVDGQLAFQACTASICDLMIWDRQTVHNLTRGTVRGGRQQWSDEGALIFTVCSYNVREPCDLRMWDGQALVTLTNTPALNEYTAVWLP